MNEQEIKQMANEMKELVKKMVKYAIALELEQAQMFEMLRDNVAESFKLELITAANLVRICVDEVVFELTGDHHYTVEQLAIICERGKSGK